MEGYRLDRGSDEVLARLQKVSIASETRSYRKGSFISLLRRM